MLTESARLSPERDIVLVGVVGGNWALVDLSWTVFTGGPMLEETVPMLTQIKFCCSRIVANKTTHDRGTLTHVRIVLLVIDHQMQSIILAGLNERARELVVEQDSLTNEAIRSSIDVLHRKMIEQVSC